MSIPITKTRIHVDPAHVLVDIELLHAPASMSAERAATLRSRLADAVEDVLDRFSDVEGGR